MKKILSITLLFLSILGSSYAFALSPVTSIINQTDIPITITKYDAHYQEQNRYGSRGIVHDIAYKNNGKKKIEAVSFGLVSFDIWNEFLDATNGISMEANDPGDVEKGSWIAQAYGDFSFHSGFAYVKKIRYEDGTIWKANLEEIKRELAKVQADFDIKNLEPKRDNNK